MSFFSRISITFSEPELDEAKTVKEIVKEGVQEVADLLKEYDEINNKFMDEEIE